MTSKGFDEDVLQAAKALSFKLLAEVNRPYKRYFQTILHLATYVLIYLNDEAKPNEELPPPCWAALEKFNGGTEAFFNR
ncbi:MAG: hypothetical protein U5L01_04380 [Rheinheimera sp.]|nr:hypothetical protein [Rheinheimera sp.]